MAFCRSRKTGNCSDYSKNRLLQEKPPETFPESFPIPGLPVLCVRWGAYPVPRAPEQQTFFGDCVCSCRARMAQRMAGH